MSRPVELKVRDQLSIRILGREFPKGTEHESDLDWLIVRVLTKDMISTVAFQDACLQGQEIVRLATSLQSLLRGKTNSAALDPLEGWWNLEFVRSDSLEGGDRGRRSLGKIVMSLKFRSQYQRVEHAVSTHTYDFGIDVGDIEKLVDQCAEAIKWYPTLPKPND